MNDTNDIQVDNDIPVSNEVRYTNNDVPTNAHGVAHDNAAYSEFGSTESVKAASESVSGVSFTSDFDIMKIAATFAVVAVVAMTVVVDESPFGEFFDPVVGIITEGFGGESSGYDGEVSMTYLVTDTEIDYHVEFSTDPGSDVHMTVTNPNTDRNIDLSEGTDGTVAGLKAGMRYSIAVLVGGETVLTRTVTMQSNYDEAPMFTLVYAKCYCDVDDSYHFRFDVVDRNGVWSGYSAKLIVSDSTGTQEFACTFVGEPTDAQTISTVGIPSGTTEATLLIQCVKTVDGVQSTETLYNETVKV